MKNRLLGKLLSLALVPSCIAGMLPATASAAESSAPVATGIVGESKENPILISTMDELIEEMERDVSAPTYYKLTEDVSHETSIDQYWAGEDWKTGDDGYNTVRKPEMAQCVV